MNNRKHNSKNQYQGRFKRVLCICSAGLLRSPTAAVVLSQEPFNYNTRAAGVDGDYALFPLDSVHLHWADEVVCMEAHHEVVIRSLGYDGKVIVLGIPDKYAYRDPELMKLIKKNYEDALMLQEVKNTSV
jgi:predicted protein tyrosine phosphatase